MLKVATRAELPAKASCPSRTPALAKIREHGHEHREILVYFGLRDFDADFDVALVAWQQVILEIAGYLGAIDPPIEKPIQPPVLLENPDVWACASQRWP
jgi:hypothetical protein